jgi:hypothetical protein
VQRGASRHEWATADGGRKQGMEWCCCFWCEAGICNQEPLMHGVVVHLVCVWVHALYEAGCFGGLCLSACIP